MHTLIIGLDAFDPQVFEQLYEQGRMPNLGRYVTAGGYSRFAVSNPAQSEVSWTSIATGANPGSHGLFDFVHRDPASYNLSVSLLPTKGNRFGTQFIPPYQTRTIFEQATHKGYPATALWWPATFPARLELPVRTIPGLGTPDIQGRLGVGTLFTEETGLAGEKLKTQIETLHRTGRDGYSGQLKGPSQQKKGGAQRSSLEFSLELLEDGSARFHIGNYDFQLRSGSWSPILELTFRLGMFFSIKAVTRAILNRSDQGLRLYFLPLQIHPLSSPWRYATPPGFIKRTWQSAGPFLTLGWPQDTTALEEGWINDEQFLELCESVDHSRERVLKHHLNEFGEGIIGIVFDTLDRIQHMFWRDRPDLIADWYQKLDGLVGRIVEHAQRKGKPRIIVVSDHGFSNFNYKIHLNRWLIDHGYLAASTNGSAGNLRAVDWSRSQFYALGLNSLYLNLAGREGQGSVTAAEKEELSRRLCEELLAWRGPDGRSVALKVHRQDEALEGPLAGYGPDLLVGYNSGYRASAETGLGEWGAERIETNRDHWGADHCIEPELVPGVLFSNAGLQDYPSPSYREFPALAIDMPLEHGDRHPARPTYNGQEDQSVVEERLRDLGYL